ncbi:SET domain-containing protein [Armillaria gallica]|uniref:SET domain-containing protein n=1 Tax=Armillaria gallica TaxID=47427 RepID=A0A2H3DNP9_ARMGA|nr:SET domain-containing protein [Armillaria gallica]
MVHRFLNAAKANWRFSKTLKPTARNVKWNPQMNKMRNFLEQVNGLNREDFELLMRMLGLPDDDIEAWAPLPDEHDPGLFEYESHPDDDVRIHVQVGNSQCLLTNWVKQRLEHIPGFPRPVKETGGAYRISSTLHTGLGMFAAHRFKMGDLIADERPLMVFPIGPPTDVNFITSMLNGARNEPKYAQDLLGSIFERMSEESREVFMGLCTNGRLHDGPVLGVALANGYYLADDLKDETETVQSLLAPLAPDDELLRRLGRYSSVGKDLSRVNHSCSPNAAKKFRMSTFSMQLRAARDIEEGEEITTAYTDNLEPAAERARHLLSRGIDCSCPACLDPAKSDPIRTAVRNRPVLYSPRGARQGDAWISPALQTLARIEEEGLEASPEYSYTLRQVFNAYVYVKDEENALVYGKKLWLANLAAGNPLYDMFRNVESMKKSLQWTRPKWLWGVQKRHVLI